MILDELNDDVSVAEKLGTLFVKNHGLNIEDEHEFRKLVTETENLPPQPNSYQEIRQTNMGKSLQMKKSNVKWKLDQTVVRFVNLYKFRIYIWVTKD